MEFSAVLRVIIVAAFSLCTTSANDSGANSICSGSLSAVDARSSDEAELSCSMTLLQIDHELKHSEPNDSWKVELPLQSSKGLTVPDTAIPLAEVIAEAPSFPEVIVYTDNETDNVTDNLTGNLTEVPVLWYKSGIWVRGRAKFGRRNASLPLTVSAEHDQASQERVHTLAMGVMLPATFIFLLDLAVGRVLRANKYMRYIPETLLTVAVAVLLGLAIRNLVSWGVLSLTDFTLVNASILNLFLLPIIIFNSAWSMNLLHFVSQLPYILIFAVVGTGVTMMVIGWSSWYLAQWGFHEMTGLRENFAFAVLISATDPVATLATFAQFSIADKQPLLNILVMGESILNDAVAIAMFKVINSFEVEGSLCVSMSVQLFGSIACGLGLACVLVLVMRMIKYAGSDKNTDMLFLFLSPYFVFSLSESLELSGIISTLFAGIVMQKYASQLLGRASGIAVTEMLEAMARLADNGVFILCGTSTALITSDEGVWYGLIAIGLCLVSRVVAVLLCSGMTNGIKRLTDDYPHTISRGQMFMIWLSGLRGGIALMLALELDSKWIDQEDKSQIVNSTFLVICVMLLVCGTATEPCLYALDMVPKPGQPPAIQRDLSDSMLASRLPCKIVRWMDDILGVVLLGGDRQPFKDFEDDASRRTWQRH